MATDDEIVQLLDHTFAALCAQPVSLFLDGDAVLGALDAATAPEALGWAQQTLFVPTRVRLLALAAQSDIPLGAWLPADVSAALSARMAGPVHLPKKLIDEVVASDKVRDATRQMLSDALTTFVQRAAKSLSADKPGGAAGASGGGLRGALGWGAKAAGSVLGGLTEGLQQQLLDRAREQVDGLVGNVQQRITERLSSDDTAKALGQRRAKFVARLLAMPEREAVKGAGRVAWAEVDAVVPQVVAHNVGRAALRDAVRAEVEAAKVALADETVGSFLDRLGLRVASRALFVRVGVPMVRTLLAGEGHAALAAVVTGSATDPATDAPSAASQPVDEPSA